MNDAISIGSASHLQHKLWRRPGRFRSSSWIKGALTLQLAFSYNEIQMSGQIDGDEFSNQDEQPFPDEFVREADHFLPAFSKISSLALPARSGRATWIDWIYKSASAHS